MYTNIGKKIQGVVSIITFLGMILSCIIGIIFGRIFYSIFDNNKGTAVLLAILVLIVGIILTWLSSLRLFAFGKIAECNEEQCQLLQKLIYQSMTEVQKSEFNKVQKSEFNKEQQSDSKKESKSIFNNEEKKKEESQELKKPTKKFCPNCGLTLVHNELICPACGTMNNSNF